MEVNITPRNMSELNILGRSYSCPATHDDARATETHKLALSELLFHIFIRVTVVVCLFGLAGCSAPEVSSEQGQPEFRMAVACEHFVFTGFAVHPSDGPRS